MAQALELKLATLSDACQIGLMSREFIEYGLHWSWDETRVARQIRRPDTTVLIARMEARLVGFAIMRFFDDSAHLNLLAVDAGCRRQGVGRRLLEWLEKSARVAGTFFVSLEVRASNQGARAFYQQLGYTEILSIPNYYCGLETAIRMTRDLRRRRLLTP